MKAHVAPRPCSRQGSPINASLLPHAFLCALLGGAPTAQGASAPAGDPDTPDRQSLKELSIEELMQLDVTIASRSEEDQSHVPGAVYVLTGDEIRRAGHSSVPEALRMVPGFYVSHWTTAAWDVTARGFSPGLSLTSSAFLNQLVVMIDGVVAYSPLFAGTWWHLYDIDLNDVERIEIMRGPGGSLWGTNATHGVVNVITKSTDDTRGPRVSLRNATDDRHVGVRYGGKLGDKGNYRVWAKGAWYDTLQDSQLDFDNSWDSESTGFRADWEAGGRQFTLSSRLYKFANHAFGFDVVGGLTIPVIDEKKGYQIYGSMANPDGSVLQAWFTSEQQAQPTFIDTSIHQFDLEYHREFALSNASRLTLGTGYRRIQSDLTGDDPTFADFDPHNFTQDTFRGYALDRIALPDWNSELTLGLTLEHNDFTQFELQPTARMTWTPTADMTLWSAISRAVRTPSLEERTLSSGSFFVGSDQFRSEELTAYELGARKLLSPSASVDLALFFNDYDHLHFQEDNGLGQFLLTNDARGKAYGAELAVDVKPSARWTLRSAYSFVRGEYENVASGNDLSTDEYYPQHQFNLRSYYDLGEDWELDSAVYVVEKMGAAFDIAEYVRVDLRLGWRPYAGVECFVGVQDVNDATHSEFSDTDLVRRAIIVGLNWAPGASDE